MLNNNKGNRMESKFKVGQKWQMRNGDVATIEDEEMDHVYASWSNRISSFSASGCYRFNGDESPFDLLTLLEDAQTEYAPAQLLELDPTRAAGSDAGAVQAGSLSADLQAVHAFLDGREQLDGVWYGERHPTLHGSFWWRKYLRDAAAQSAPAAQQVAAPDDVLRAIRHKAYQADQTSQEISEIFHLANDAINAIAGAPSVQQPLAVPAAWKPMPPEPTGKMIGRGRAALYDGRTGQEVSEMFVKRCYAAMFTSAPTQSPAAPSELLLAAQQVISCIVGDKLRDCDMGRAALANLRVAVGDVERAQ